MASHRVSQTNLRLNNYVLEKNNRIGRGSSGVVYLGHHIKTKEKVAIKRLDISQMSDKMTRIWNEIQIMKETHHPNVIMLYDVFIDLENNYLYLIMEYCDGSDLTDYTKNYTMDLSEIHKIMTQIKDGLEYLRSKGIMHRDLKPQNILLHKGNAKIADFGLSIMIEGEAQLLNTMCGSPLYMSPEIIEHQKYTAKSDLWSIGVILYQLIYHKHPYNHCSNLPELTKKVREMAIEYPDFPPIDPLTMDLMHGLLNKNCHNRMTWDEFFGHQWFRQPMSLSNLANSFSPPSNGNLELFHFSMERRKSLIHQRTPPNKERPNRSHSPDNSESDSETDFYSLSHSNSDSFGSIALPDSVCSSTNSVCYPKSRPTVIIHSRSPDGSNVLNLTDFMIKDYQKKNRQRPITGTSAPMRSQNIDYSPSKLNFGSVGSSLVKYANKSFSWFKSSIDY